MHLGSQYACIGSCSTSLVCIAQEFLPLGHFSELEAANFKKLKEELRSSIQKGVDFVHRGERALATAGHE